MPRSVVLCYAVPAFGTIDAIADLQDASNIEHKVAIRWASKPCYVSPFCDDSLQHAMG